MSADDEPTRPETRETSRALPILPNPPREPDARSKVDRLACDDVPSRDAMLALYL